MRRGLLKISRTSSLPIHHQIARNATNASPTGIVMLNMGGPEKVSDTGAFLHNLFTDRNLIQIPFQRFTGPFLAKSRTPSVEKLYEEIGGSPIRKFTESQGKLLAERLNSQTSSESYKSYVAFRYTNPTIYQALEQMKEDGVKRAIAFSQYPQFSCTTIGSSLKQLWSATKEMGLESKFEWSVIDRWATHPKFIQATKTMIQRGLEKFSNPSEVVIMFSAHSLPLRTVFKGDQYVHEVSASAYAVMKEMNFSHQYIISWQSQVGRIPWIEPKTEKMIHELGKDKKSILIVPIAFTSDHIETLSEIDIGFRKVAEEAGVKEFHRSPSLNDDPVTIDCLSSIVSDHVASKQLYSLQYTMRCPGCVDPECRSVVNPAPDSRITSLPVV